MSYPLEAAVAGVVASVEDAPAAVARDRLVGRPGTGVPQDVVEGTGGEVWVWIGGPTANGGCEALDGGDTAGADFDLLGAADRDVVDRLDAPEEIGRELEPTFDPEYMSHQVVGDHRELVEVVQPALSPPPKGDGKILSGDLGPLVEEHLPGDRMLVHVAVEGHRRE